MSVRLPRTAMVLAGGLGLRLRPLTDTTPKPLVPVAGKALLDWSLDALARAGVETAVVNVHYLPDQIIAHVQGRTRPAVLISDERHQLLDSGGGIAKALPLLGTDPFYIVNADTFWIDRDRSNLQALALGWDGAGMDMRLMLCDAASATGYEGKGDFSLDGEARLRRAEGDPDALIYAGAAIADPALFRAAGTRPHSLNLYFDRAIARGRLFGMRMEGDWLTVGTPDAVARAEAALVAARRAR